VIAQRRTAGLRVTCLPAKAAPFRAGFERVVLPGDDCCGNLGREAMQVEVLVHGRCLDLAAAGELLLELGDPRGQDGYGFLSRYGFYSYPARLLWLSPGGVVRGGAGRPVQRQDRGAGNGQDGAYGDRDDDGTPFCGDDSSDDERGELAEARPAAGVVLGELTGHLSTPLMSGSRGGPAGRSSGWS